LDSEPKQLELLQKALPSLTRVAVLTNADSVDIEQAQWTKAAARSLRIDLTEYSIRSPEQLLVAMAAIGDARTQAVLFRGTLWFLDAKQVAALALRHRLPTIHNLREFPQAGALMSYGVNFAELNRRSATFVDRILKGASPAELPVEQPTKFELLINLNTAKMLGLDLPATLIALADEVIE
jgi:putative ABC transport system substrate-binding protein